MNVRKLVQLSLFTVTAVTIFMIEAALPALSPIQGIKLGLANIVTLVLLQYYSTRDVLLVLLARILLSSILSGQLMSFLYSLSGGLCCFGVMVLIHRILGKKYICITSIIGAVFHNIGQILAAVLLLHSWGIVVYVPLLMISGILTGLFTGCCAYFFHKKMGGWIKRLQQE